MHFLFLNVDILHLLLHDVTFYLVNNQLDAQFFYIIVYFNPLHVSSEHVLIKRRSIVLIQHLV